MFTGKRLLQHVVAYLLPTILICAFLTAVGSNRYHHSKLEYLAAEARNYERGFRPATDIVGGVIISSVCIGLYTFTLGLMTGRFKGED